MSRKFSDYDSVDNSEPGARGLRAPGLETKMPPRKTTDFGALFESLVDDLRIQIAASVDHSLSELEKRLARIERRLDAIDPQGAKAEAAVAKRACVVCGRSAVARGLCSAHYQQWRYRSRKVRPTAEAQHVAVPGVVIPPQLGEISADN
jgi:hypothetical protein